MLPLGNKKKLQLQCVRITKEISSTDVRGFWVRYEESAFLVSLQMTLMQVIQENPEGTPP